MVGNGGKFPTTGGKWWEISHHWWEMVGNFWRAHFPPSYFPPGMRYVEKESRATDLFGEFFQFF